MTIDQLASLALERRAIHGCAEGVQTDLAERFGADPGRLAAVLGE